MKAFKLCSIIKVFVISMVLFVFWILILNLVPNKRKLFSYLSFSEYTAINVKIDYLDRREDRALDWNQYPVVEENKVNKIVIITEARSGSTFLGDLLQQSWPTFYSFEPLINMRIKNPRNDKTMTEEASDLLNNILDCSFSQEFLSPVFWKVAYFNWNQVLKKTANGDSVQLFNETINRLVCQRCPNRLIKTIRFGVEDFMQLHEKSKTPIKLVFLVRDPRGVMSSRYRMTWCINSPNCTDVEVLCQRMREDIYSLKILSKWSNESIALVRYEDLSLDPMKTSERLYEKMGLKFTIPIQMWIREHTKVADILSNPHSTTRDSKSAPFIWFTRLTVNEVIEVQEYCSDVMTDLGYKQIVDIDYEDDNETKPFSHNYTLDQIMDSNFPLHHLIP